MLYLKNTLGVHNKQVIAVFNFFFYIKQIDFNLHKKNLW
jgi:hypothetical protein